MLRCEAARICEANPEGALAPDSPALVRYVVGRKAPRRMTHVGARATRVFYLKFGKIWKILSQILNNFENREAPLRGFAVPI